MVRRIPTREARSKPPPRSRRWPNAASTSPGVPKPWTVRSCRPTDVVGQWAAATAPDIPGTRCEDWPVDDPEGMDLSAVAWFVMTSSDVFGACWNPSFRLRQVAGVTSPLLEAGDRGGYRDRRPGGGSVGSGIMATTLSDDLGLDLRSTRWPRSRRWAF